MNKKIKTEVAIAVILLVSIIFGVIFYFWEDGGNGDKIVVSSNVYKRENLNKDIESDIDNEGRPIASKNVYQKENKTVSSNNNQSVCPDDIKICFDGTIPERIEPGCEFMPCSNKEKKEKNGWKTWINNDEGYSISYPSEFWPQGGHDIINYDINDSRYIRGNPDGIKIQVQKDALDARFNSPEEYIKYQLGSHGELRDAAQRSKLGDFVDMYQYNKDGPGGAFAIYTAFGKKTRNYYRILIFEPGYSKNKKLIEKIVATFKVL